MNRVQIPMIIFFLFVIGQTGCAQHQTPVPTKNSAATFQLEEAFPNLSFTRPLDLENAGDGTNRIFVVEQSGRIFVFPNDENVPSSKLFLDIRSRVKSTGNEEGLLGLAFHPDFKSNGYFYVDYTRPTNIPNAASQTTISRFKVKADNSDEADPQSEFIILQITQPYTNHNGGRIMFGPDGYLYIGMGDGGSAGDPQNNAQNKKSLLGKVLRIDVDQTNGNQNYSIPSDNPFVGNLQGWQNEIWTYGMRNPWRFSYDKITNRWWCADVGQDKIEEVDILERGKNYGWRIMEGSSCYNPSSGCDTTGLTLPIAEYDHTIGMSITGGFVYRGSQVPVLAGAYIYADYVSGKIWEMRYDGKNVSENNQIVNSGLNIASFGVDENQELYICAFDGKIYRFAKPASGELKLNPPEIDFGTLNPADPPQTKLLIATNTGNGKLKIPIQGLVSTDTGFQMRKMIADSLLPGTSDTAVFTFTPQQNQFGSKAAVYTIFTDSPSALRLNISITATVLQTTDEKENLPYKFDLHQNYPNPFGVTGLNGHASTEIQYEVGQRSLIEIIITDAIGKVIETPVADIVDAGSYKVRFNPNALSNGIYFCKMMTDHYSKVIKMLVVR